MKKYFLLTVLMIGLGCAQLSQAQMRHVKHDGWVWGPSVGYQYQKGNFVKASLWGLFALNPSQYMKIDAGANATWMMDQTTIIPELGISYYLNNVAVWPFIKAEVTPYTVTGKVGVSLFSLLELSAGYGASLQTKKDFKPIDGFTFGLGVNLPLKLHL